jgi:hypothetical protein
VAEDPKLSGASEYESPGAAWSRDQQELAEAAFPEAPPAAEAGFLDRPVGFMNRRWQIVLIGSMLGFVVGVIVGYFSTDNDFFRGAAVIGSGLVGALGGGFLGFAIAFPPPPPRA